MILSLVWSVAAPYGAVFAFSETTTESEASQETPPIAEETTPSDQTVSLPIVTEEIAEPVVVAEAPAPAAAPSQPASIATTLPSPVVPTGSILVSAFQFREEQGFEFIELRNIDDTYADVNNMSVRLLYSTLSTDYECEIILSGFMRPNSYVTYAQPSLAGTNPGAYTMTGCPMPAAGLLFDKEIQVYRANQLIESVRITEADMDSQSLKQWERKGFIIVFKRSTEQRFQILNAARLY